METNLLDLAKIYFSELYKDENLTQITTRAEAVVHILYVITRSRAAGIKNPGILYFELISDISKYWLFLKTFIFYGLTYL